MFSLLVMPGPLVVAETKEDGKPAAPFVFPARGKWRLPFRDHFVNIKDMVFAGRSAGCGEHQARGQEAEEEAEMNRDADNRAGHTLNN